MMKRHDWICKAGLILASWWMCSSVLADTASDFLDAVRAGNAAKVQSMLRQGVDPNTQDAKKQSALLIALQGGALEVADILIANPRTDVNKLSENDESPLMLAAIKGFSTQAKALIVRDALVNKTGWTPLHYAASQADTALITLMIDNYAYIDAESPNGTTPLMMAARYGTLEGVKLLLEEGADPMLKNQLGLTAYDFAMQGERKDSAELILRAMRSRQPGGW